MSISSGILDTALQIQSPHFNQRPTDDDISLLVIHNISLPPGQFGGRYINDFFVGQLDPNAHPFFEEIADLKVSAHLLIQRDGQVVQFVNFNHRAWHAGRSVFLGRENCNDFSIGIELEGTDDIDYADEQYTVLIQVTRRLIKAYPKIGQERICGHNEIAPNRKTDPGACFDWHRYKRGI